MRHSASLRSAAWLLPLVLLLVSGGCRSRRDLASLPGVGDLMGRCIRLKRTMLLLREVEGQPAEVVLVPENSIGPDYENNPMFVSRLEAGSELVVQRIFLESSFDNVGVRVVANERNSLYGRRMGISYIFDVKWLMDAWKWATPETHRGSKPPDPSVVLKARYAEWCS